MARCAEFERALIQERVRAGVRNARHKGKQLGRPSKKLDRDKILRLRQSGLSWRDIANELGAGVATVIRAAGLPSIGSVTGALVWEGLEVLVAIASVIPKWSSHSRKSLKRKTSISQFRNAPKSRTRDFASLFRTGVGFPPCCFRNMMVRVSLARVSDNSERPIIQPQSGPDLVAAL